MDENSVITRNKARIVAKGYNQDEGIDYEEIYAPIARLEAIWLLLAFTCFLDFKLYQIDFKHAFLNDYKNEEVYVSQPHSFEDHENPNYIFLILSNREKL